MERQSYLALCVGMIVAAVLHLAAAPLLRYGFVPREPDAPTPVPKLTITDAQAPELVKQDQSFTLTYAVANEGDALAAPPWNDRVFFSQDRTLSPDDVLVSTLPQSAALSPGGSYTRRLDLAPPVKDFVGHGYLFIEIPLPANATANAPTASATDSDDRQKFSVVRALPLWIDSGKPVQLAITQVDAPPAVMSGGDLRIHWTVQNTSEGLAFGEWSDLVVLSPDPTLSGDDLLLGEFQRPRRLPPGDSYASSSPSLYIPRKVEGKQYLIIVADCHDQVAADALSPSSPRVSVTPIEVEQLDLPDLAVVEVDVPGTVIFDKPASFKYVVQNIGSAPPPKKWLDGVYLSSDDKLSDDDTEITTAPVPAMIGPGEFYVEDELVFTVPAGTPVPVYLIVKADVDDVIDEGPFKENNVKAVRLNVVDQPESEVGRVEPPFKPSVAWISYDDFKELEARRDEYLQPAVQAMADPVKLARFTLDPTQPATAPSPDANEPTPQEQQPTPTESKVQSNKPADAVAARPETERRDDYIEAAASPETTIKSEVGPGAEQITAPSDRQRPGRVPAPITGEAKKQPDKPSNDPTDTQGQSPEKSETTAKTDGPSPTDTQGDTKEDAEKAGSTQAVEASESPQQTPSQARKGDTPTAAPREDRESPPVTRIKDTLVVVPGAVYTAQGVEIKTFAPRPTTVALFSTVPNNPEAILLFDNTGAVVDVTLVRSTGSPNWDGPVMTSLYRWKAKGPKIDRLHGTLAVPVRLILSPE